MIILGCSWYTVVAMPPPTSARSRCCGLNSLTYYVSEVVEAMFRTGSPLVEFYPSGILVVKEGCSDPIMRSGVT